MFPHRGANELGFKYEVPDARDSHEIVQVDFKGPTTKERDNRKYVDVTKEGTLRGDI
jgi:hypothetical protein